MACIQGVLRVARVQNTRASVPWPTTIGIDEPSFKRNRNLGRKKLTSLIVDYNKGRIFEAVEGKSADCLRNEIKHISRRENEINVILDLCDPFKKFAHKHFPNAQLVGR